MSNRPILDKLRFMLTMATADGSITAEELRLFSHRSLEWGVSDDEFEALLDEAAQDETATPSVPEDQEERYALLKELVYMMAADGQMHRTERQMFAGIAAQMNISENELNGVIDSAIADQR